MADAPLIVTKAVASPDGPLTRSIVASGGVPLVKLTFSDGTHFSIYPDSPTRIYAHDLYDNFLAAGGVLE